MSENLEQRIAAALADDATASTTVCELLEETEAAILAADATAEEERAKAMDPALSPDPKAARAAMEDATFAADRLRTLLPRLQKHLSHVQYVEAHTSWRKDYEAVKAERDAAAEKLKVLYPEVVTKLVTLLARIREIDAKIRRLNDAKPHARGEPWDGLPSLAPTECEARGVTGFNLPEYSLDRGVALPDFHKPGQKVWPPYELPLAAVLAERWRWG
jgi:hypothetical protein